MKFNWIGDIKMDGDLFVKGERIDFSAFLDKEDLTKYYNKDEIDSMLDEKVNSDEVYSKPEIDGKISILNMSVETNSTAINTTNSEIEALQRNVAALTGLTNTLEENVETNASDIGELNSKVNTHQGNITVINQLLADIEADVETTNNAINGLTASVDYISEYKADTSTVDGVISDVSTLTDRVDANDVDITANAANIIAMQSSITKLQDNNVQISKDIASVNSIATIAQSRADSALARNEFTDEEKTKLANITNPMVIKGRVDTVADLPTIAQVGWFYFVGTEGSSSYMEYCYSQSGSWEYIGATTTGVDLSNYYTKSQIDEKISGVTNDVTGLDIRLTQEEDKVFKLGQDIATNTSNIETNTKDITAIKLANQQTEGILNGVREDVELSKTNIETNTSNINSINSEISTLKGRVSANTQLANDIEANINGEISTLKGRVSANTQLTNDIEANINGEISTLKGRVSANTQLANDIESNVQTNTADIANNKKTIGILQGTLGFEAKNKFNNTTTSSTVSGVTFTVNSDGTITANGTATANITFQLKPNLYIQNNNWAGNIFSFGVIEPDKKYRGFIQYYNSSWTLQTSTYLNSTETILSDYYCAIASIYITKGTTLSNVVFKPMIRDANIEDDSYSSYGGLSVIKRFDRFSTQKLLYSTTTSNASPLTVNVSNLFANYSAVVCYIRTSSNTTPYNLTLPLKYIKSLGSGNYYNADSQLMFEYVDDSNLRILTGMAQSNPTIENVRIISLY